MEEFLLYQYNHCPFSPFLFFCPAWNPEDGKIVLKMEQPLCDDEATNKGMKLYAKDKGAERAFGY